MTTTNIVKAKHTSLRPKHLSSPKTNESLKSHRLRHGSRSSLESRSAGQEVESPLVFLYPTRRNLASLFLQNTNLLKIRHPVVRIQAMNQSWKNLQNQNRVKVLSPHMMMFDGTRGTVNPESLWVARLVSKLSFKLFLVILYSF